jgi:hypothetical protein
MIERCKRQTPGFHVEDPQPSLLREIISKKGEGFIAVSRNDLILRQEAATRLAPGATSTFLPFHLPSTFLLLQEHEMRPIVEMGSRLGQAMLDVKQEIVDDTIVVTLVNNHPLHTYEVGELLDIGKLVARGAPLCGDDLTRSLEAEMYCAPEGMQVFPEEGTLHIPVAKHFISNTRPRFIDTSTMPRAHDRKRLHHTLGIEVATRDCVATAEHQGHYLSATEPIGFSRNSALLVEGGSSREQSFVEHCSAKLCQGGDNPWRIMNETYGLIDEMRATFYNAVIV